MQITELFGRFFELEKREGLMDKRIGNVPYWHLVRMPIFRYVLDAALTLKSAHPDFSAARPPSSRIRRLWAGMLGMWQGFLDLTVRNPLLAFRSRPLLFSMTPRQAILADGHRVSLLLDFFTPLLRTRYALLEHVIANPVSHPFFRRVFHLPRERRRFEKCRKNGWFADVSRERGMAAEEIAEILSKEFGITVDRGFVSAQIDGALLYREVYRPVLRRMLLRMRVKVLVTAVHYNLPNFTLAEVAHDLGIKVVELQHGTIYKSHAAYNLSSSGSVYSPDFLVTWGEYWNRQTRNYPEKGHVPAGYPYLERIFSQYEFRRHSGNPRTVLFVSQANIADALISSAMALRKCLSQTAFRIVYKLHPNESRSWKDLYPELLSSSIETVSNDEKNIYACLAEADVVVGSCSTALVEGASRGLETLVLKWLPGADTMTDFIDSGLMRSVETQEKLMTIISSCNGGVEVGDNLRGSLFKMPESAVTIARFLDESAIESLMHPFRNMIK